MTGRTTTLSTGLSQLDPHTDRALRSCTHAVKGYESQDSSLMSFHVNAFSRSIQHRSTMKSTWVCSRPVDSFLTRKGTTLTGDACPRDTSPSIRILAVTYWRTN